MHIIITITALNFYTNHVLRNFSKDVDKLEKVKALREASKRVTVGSDTLPSICFYTLMNAVHT